MRRISLNPVTRRKLKRFVSIRRGFWSFVIIFSLIVFSFAAELFINSRALVVRYQALGTSPPMAT